LGRPPDIKRSQGELGAIAPSHLDRQARGPSV
jgi:hypothetical protein